MSKAIRAAHLAFAALAFAAFGSAAGAAEPAATCISDCDCPAGQLCHAQEGRGACQAAACTRIFAPVCGLDGKTYGNACEAHAAHVVVAHKGECARMCGGIAAIPCKPGELCDPRPGNCKTADIDGTCVKRPTVCKQDVRPVCGCDGKTYNNDCERLRKGVALDHKGNCGIVPPTTH